MNGSTLLQRSTTRSVWVQACARFAQGKLFLFAIALLPIALDLFVSLRQWGAGWDDGSITAAFARTWALSGRIALTPTSVTVEGFSSLLWFWLLSLPSFLTHNAFWTIVWMKTLAAVFALLCLPLVYSIARTLSADAASPRMAVLLLATCPTTFYEIVNGMEMQLDAFLLLLLFYVLIRPHLRGRVAFASAVCFLLLLTRFESPFQMALMFAGMLLALRRGLDTTAQTRYTPSLRQLLLIALVVLALFGGVEWWRHATFGLWMPNTVYAKQLAPYTLALTPRALLHARLKAMAEPLGPLKIALAVAAGAILLTWRPRWLWAAGLNRVHPAVFTVASGCFLFGGLFGPNWGYPGRMIVPMLPFLILLIAAALGGAMRLQPELKRVLVPALAVYVLVWLNTTRNPSTLVTVNEVAAVGAGADDIRAALGENHMVVMLPDVGGSSLFHDKLTIVDSALLANPVLSRVGWKNFSSYFYATRPEVVETQAGWVRQSRIYTDGLLQDYSIVAADGVRLFVRNDLYRQLLARHAGPVLPVDEVPGCLPPREEDWHFSLSKKTCLVLNDRNAQRNFY